MDNLTLDKRRKCFWAFPIMPTSVSIVKSNIDGCYELRISAGLFHKEIKSIKLYRVVDVSFYRNFFDLIWFRGNLDIRSTDPKMKALRVTKIRKAKEFKAHLESLINEDREKAGVKYNELNVLS